jgi:hypothetical protein
MTTGAHNHEAAEEPTSRWELEQLVRRRDCDRARTRPGRGGRDSTAARTHGDRSRAAGMAVGEPLG